jgi:hypothetical protein
MIGPVGGGRIQHSFFDGGGPCSVGDVDGLTGVLPIYESFGDLRNGGIYWSRICHGVTTLDRFPP